MKNSIQPNREIKNISQIDDENGSALMHIINFEKKGFCIVSATKKMEPILAYSETGYFDKNKILNIGLEMWIDHLSMDIRNSHKLSESEIVSNRLQWIDFEKINTATKSSNSNEQEQRVLAFNKRLGELSGNSNTTIPLSAAASYLPSNRLQHFKTIASQHNSPEHFTIIEIIDKTHSKSIGPLINTNWHQSSPFNQLVPNDYAGCTAVAAGQIMNFYNHPNNYDWNKMSPSNLNVHDDIQYLMKDLGISFDMEYKSDGSGANIDDVKRGLRNDYNYQVEKRDHFPRDVRNSLFNDQRPVYMTGKKTKGFMGLIYKDGHAWVCEGAKEYQPNKAFTIEWQVNSNGSYGYDSNGIIYNETAQTRTAHRYMNWGWGSSYNGWYGVGSTQPAPGEDFQYKRVNLYINP